MPALVQAEGRCIELSFTPEQIRHLADLVSQERTVAEKDAVLLADDRCAITRRLAQNRLRILVKLHETAVLVDEFERVQRKLVRLPVFQADPVRFIGSPAAGPGRIAGAAGGWSHQPLEGQHCGGCQLPTPFLDRAIGELIDRFPVYMALGQLLPALHRHAVPRIRRIGAE